MSDSAGKEKRYPRRSVIMATGIVALFMFLYNGYQMTQSSVRSGLGLSGLEREFDSVKLPPRTQSTSDVRRLSRVVFLSVSQDFVSYLSVEELADYYHHAFTSNGWQVVDRASGAVHRWRYCKSDNLIATVDVIAGSVYPIRYYFGIGWEGQPHARVACSSKIKWRNGEVRIGVYVNYRWSHREGVTEGSHNPV